MVFDILDLCGVQCGCVAEFEESLEPVYKVSFVHGVVMIDDHTVFGHARKQKFHAVKGR